MSLENIYYIGQTLAVVAILGSLIALLIQMRQGNRLVRAQLTSEIQAAFSEDTQFIIEDEAFADIYNRAFSSSGRLTNVEITRFTAWVEKMQMDAERAYFLNRNKLIDADVLRRFERLTVWHHLNSALHRAHWARHKSSRFAPKFVEYFDDLVATTAPASPSSLEGYSTSEPEPT